MTYKVVEIFDSIEGEGRRSGQPASFIRLAGCNLRCSYCDTRYAWLDDQCEYVELNADEILDKINKDYMRVTLTGGEPLIADGIVALVNILLEHGFEINIETNGAVDINMLLDRIDIEYKCGRLFLTVDYKLPSSGFNNKVIDKNYTSLKTWDVIKFVVGSDEDVESLINLMQSIQPLYDDTMPYIYIGAVYGQYDMKKLVNIILNTPVLRNAHLQMQLHKLIWDENERGV